MPLRAPCRPPEMGPTPEGRQRFPVRRTMKHNRVDARRDLSLGEVHLVASLGKDAGGLSASTIGRLKEAWSEEHTRWSKCDLSAKRYVYFWVDGIHVQARLENDAQCLLVIIGATPSAGCSRSPRRVRQKPPRRPHGGAADRARLPGVLGLSVPPRCDATSELPGHKQHSD